jgi:hypothetical protein
LRDAALYITKLPKAEHDAEPWQAAMEALLLVAEHDGPTMFASIGVMRALNRHVQRVFNPDRKDHHWGNASRRETSDGYLRRRGLDRDGHRRSQAAIESGLSIEEAAEFPCRADSVDDVARKCVELGLTPRFHPR